MSSIGSGLFSRLSRNSVRELLSRGKAFPGLWALDFEPREHLSSIKWGGLKELPVRELDFGD